MISSHQNGPGCPDTGPGAFRALGPARCVLSSLGLGTVGHEAAQPIGVTLCSLFGGQLARRRLDQSWAPQLEFGNRVAGKAQGSGQNPALAPELGTQWAEPDMVGDHQHGLARLDFYHLTGE